MKRIILTDVDGVCLDWEYAFSTWMKTHGFEPVPGYKFNYLVQDRYGISSEQTTKLIHNFNESAGIGFLPALRDAAHYVKKLHQDGFVFHAITSVGGGEPTHELRKMNMRKLFGETAFEEIICLPLRADKREVLSAYANTGYLWIEDTPKQAEVGADLGLTPLLMVHGHNMHHFHPKVTPVRNWQEIANWIDQSSLYTESTSLTAG